MSSPGDRAGTWAAGSGTLDLAIIGAGYVGLVSACCLAAIGHRVTVLEANPHRLATLRQGRVPFHEPGLQDLMVAGMANGRLHVSGNAPRALRGRDAILICVGTPLGESGAADLRQIRGACSSVAVHGGGAVVAVRSTLPPGVSAVVLGWLGRGADAGSMVTNPEFLREGSAVSDFMAPTRIVIGTGDGQRSRGAEVVERMYGGLRAPVIITDYATADMIKNASNAFLATRLTFINEIADLCEANGADIDQVVRGMGLDPRIGPGYLRPGIGFGGSCLPKELTTLTRSAQRAGVSSTLLRAAGAENDRRAGRVALRLDRWIRGLRGRRVAILGLSFKPNTDDLRSSPAIMLARALIARGARVVGHDPSVPIDATRDIEGLGRATDVEGALRHADLVVLATEWVQYRDLAWGRLAGLVARPLLFDGRNALDAAALRAAGWSVARIGGADPERQPAAHAGPRRRPAARARTDEAAPAGARNGTNRRRSGPPRFFLYSHDAVGLGHLRRNLNIARAIHDLSPDATILLASGADGLEALSIPPGLDVLRLPGMRKDADGRYVSRRLALGASEILRLRAELLSSAIERLRPDVVLADKHPAGIGNELLPALRSVRRDGGHTALGLRDVLDEPSKTIREWRPSGPTARSARLHDLVLVYGSERVLKPFPDGFLPARLAGPLRYCGYVVGASAGSRPADLPRNGRGARVLATVGGGEDGWPVLDAFLDAARSAPWHGVLVAGPMLDEAAWAVVARRCEAAGVNGFRSVADVERWFPHVDALVSMGGYNTLLEALATATPTVCVPRVQPRQEQAIRARTFAGHGLVSVIEPGELSGERLRDAIGASLGVSRAELASRVTERLDLDGAHRAAAALVELAAGQQVSLEQMPAGRSAP